MTLPDNTPGDPAATADASLSAKAVDMPLSAVLAARAAIAVTRVKRDIAISPDRSRRLATASCHFLSAAVSFW
ncbi:hypothetical protein JCM4914_06560 [Streptomyces platensis subsp. malvinus]